MYVFSSDNQFQLDSHLRCHVSELLSCEEFCYNIYMEYKVEVGSNNQLWGQQLLSSFIHRAQHPEPPQTPGHTRLLREASPAHTSLRHTASSKLCP